MSARTLFRLPGYSCLFSALIFLCGFRSDQSSTICVSVYLIAVRYACMLVQSSDCREYHQNGIGLDRNITVAGSSDNLTAFSNW